MRKILLLTVLLLVGFSTTYAQNITNIAYSPNVAEFVSKAGAFLNKDRYAIDNSKLELKVVILTDFQTGNKIGYVDYASGDDAIDKKLLGPNYTASYTSTLDYDEIQSCIECLEFAKESFLKTKPETDESVFYYTTKLGGKIGVRWKNWEKSNSLPSTWRVFINADSLERPEFEKSVALSSKGVDKIIEALKNAKALIEAKTK